MTFVKVPEIGELTKVSTSVEYATDEASYEEKWARLSDDDVAAICTELGFKNLGEATVYGYNLSTGELIKNYSGFEGWRDANGDFHKWTGDANVPFCIKYSDGQNYECYNIFGFEPQTFKGYWAIANAKKYVLVEIDFIYSEPAPIELTLTDVEIEVGVNYKVTEKDYSQKDIILTSEQVQSILDAIELNSFTEQECAAYIY